MPQIHPFLPVNKPVNNRHETRKQLGFQDF